MDLVKTLVTAAIAGAIIRTLLINSRYSPTLQSKDSVILDPSRHSFLGRCATDFWDGFSANKRRWIAAGVAWLFLVQAWGFLCEWDDYFSDSQYAALHYLPIIGVFGGIALLRWSSVTQDKYEAPLDSPFAIRYLSVRFPLSEKIRVVSEPKSVDLYASLKREDVLKRELVKAYLYDGTVKLYEHLLHLRKERKNLGENLLEVIAAECLLYVFYSALQCTVDDEVSRHVEGEIEELYDFLDRITTLDDELCADIIESRKRAYYKYRLKRWDSLAAVFTTAIDATFRGAPITGDVELDPFNRSDMFFEIELQAFSSDILAGHLEALEEAFKRLDARP